MVKWANHSIVFFMVIVGILIIIDWIIDRSIKKFLIALGALVLAFFVLNITTGFPKPKVGFGDVDILLAIGIMFVCTLLGMIARYVHDMRKFSWLSFLKPLVISPIVLVPMIGTVQGANSIEPVQLVSLGILAFQNGYFWKVVFERAQRRIQTPDLPSQESEES